MRGSPIRQRRTLKARLQVELLEDRTLLSAAAFVPNELLVKFRDGVGEADKALVRALVHTDRVEQILTDAMRAAGDSGLELLHVPADVPGAVAMLQHNPLVAYAEPNWILTHQAIDLNDPYYTNGLLWGMYSDDSPSAVGPLGTKNDFGSQAEEAWAAGKIGSETVYVGIIDEGIQFTHPDLFANVWTNPGDLVDGVDNDGNGYVDDTHGWDFFYGDNTIYDGTAEDPADDHGTHVTGTIGATGGNGIGVAGVNWNVRYISGKFLGPSGGYTSDAIKALDYMTDLKTRGLNIVATNNSWGGGGFSQALLDAITRGADKNILFIAAAGNSNSNNDLTASYPSSYNTTVGAGYDAVIAVAAINSSGAKSSFSSYGATTVDLGAPGEAIYSTVPDGGYASYSGTSMATPHVTGAAALYASAHPGATAAQIRAAILSTTTATASLSGRTVTGGRLNISALMAKPALSISDVTKAEGNSGTTTFTFTVSLLNASTETVTVDYATGGGSATAGDDYTAASGTLTFTPGDTSETVTVSVIGNTIVEPDETFFVSLINPSVNAAIEDDRGTGTILDDDNLPSLMIDDVPKDEGKRGNTAFTFTVTLAPANTTTTVTVQYATANGFMATTGKKGGDYTAASGTLTFNPGETTKLITVSVKGDTIAELNETFFVNLSSPNAIVADSQGVGTIQNDDGIPASVSAFIDTASPSPKTSTASGPNLTPAPAPAGAAPSSDTSGLDAYFSSIGSADPWLAGFAHSKDPEASLEDWLVLKGRPGK